MNYLNLGCGTRFHPDWENIDFASMSPSVRAHDLRKGIPYSDETFDVVYHSHVLEHFSRGAAADFLSECTRVLKSSGVLRIVIPDLEGTARLYLDSLKKARQSVPGSREDHEWMVMEMYDQAVRERTGGGYVEYFQRDPIPNWDFVLSRWGSEATTFRQAFGSASDHTKASEAGPRIVWDYILRNPGRVLRDKFIRFVLGEKDWESLQLGRFRRSGEIHLWMYDSFSLGELLQRVGLPNPQCYGPTESQIPNWDAFHLDSEPDGSTYRPGSLFMEVVKL
jgi:predicted SAM-dependent methyltransferase